MSLNKSISKNSSQFNIRLLFILIILFSLILIFTYASNHFFKNKIIKYKVSTKIFKDESNIPSYKSNQEKYIKKSCSDLCDKNICSDYEIQLKKYNMCKKCESKGLCYQPFHGDCIKCKNLKSCEEVYGCDGKEPIDPFKKECSLCWPQIY